MPIRQIFAGLATVFLLSSAGIPAYAQQARNALDLTGPDTAQPGSTLEIMLEMAFLDPTLGGGVNIIFDEGLVQLSSIAFDDSLGDDPDFRCPGAVICPTGDSTFISFGSFVGLDSERTVASIFFDVLADSRGVAEFSLAAASPFSDEVGSALDVRLGTTQVTIVPEPGTALLLGLGLIGLAGGNRRIKTLD